MRIAHPTNRQPRDRLLGRYIRGLGDVAACTQLASPQRGKPLPRRARRPALLLTGRASVDLPEKARDEQLAEKGAAASARQQSSSRRAPHRRTMREPAYRWRCVRLPASRFSWSLTLRHHQLLERMAGARAARGALSSSAHLSLAAAGISRTPANPRLVRVRVRVRVVREEAEECVLVREMTAATTLASGGARGLLSSFCHLVHGDGPSA